MNTLDTILESLLYLLEADPRTFSKPYSPNGYFFDEIYKAYKILLNLKNYKWKEEDI